MNHLTNTLLKKYFLFKKKEERKKLTQPRPDLPATYPTRPKCVNFG